MRQATLQKYMEAARWPEGCPGEPLGAGDIRRLIKKASKNPLGKPS